MGVTGRHRRHTRQTCDHENPYDDFTTTLMIDPPASEACYELRNMETCPNYEARGSDALTLLVTLCLVVVALACGGRNGSES